ncbi:putative methyltransferase DDB_G0268948 [Uloborus diversus]|uniref:putative methyltransferase DDB_G0268948 n=1 Tax=Uloborus diversus TaxID=327109 RepID=UPI002409063D|nr:putative methyltransferase DDB_G0268948 [Uloborus diversus]
MYDKGDQVRAYSSFRPLPPTDLVDIVLNYVGEKFPMPFENAVDVGCGPGQSTIVLSPFFRSVLGCDVSKAQIHEANVARKASNIDYKISRAESLPVPDESVQLLTASTCFHWLDAIAFFKEAKRVLVPGGTLAIYSSYVSYPVVGEEGKDLYLRQITDKLLHTDLKPYRSPESQEVFAHYENVHFPFHDVTRVQDIDQTYVATVADAVGYFQSMATFQKLITADPELAGNLLQEYQNRLLETLGSSSPPEITSLTFRRSYFLILCRKRDKASEDETDF